MTGDQSWLEQRNAIYAERRDLILATLAEVGLRANKPVASLYIWAETPPGYSSADFASLLLEEAGISVTPGTAFGSKGEGYLRISMGMSTARVREAMNRLRKLTF